jgi:mannose/fructose-specific phosphotransferase system component IIA
MVGIPIVSHGGLADALISSVQSLAGSLEKIRGVSIWSKDREEEVLTGEDSLLLEALSSIRNLTIINGTGSRAWNEAVLNIVKEFNN